MKSKVLMVLRILLGIFVLVFGLNKFANFLPAIEGMSPDALSYFASFMTSKTVYLVGAVEILTGIALLANKFGALMSLILMSVSVNAVLFHAVLDPANIGPALALLALNIAALYNYKSEYRALLNG